MGTQLQRYAQNNRNETCLLYINDGVKFEVINTDPYSDARFSVPQKVLSTILIRQTSIERMRQAGEKWRKVMDLKFQREKTGCTEYLL